MSRSLAFLKEYAQEESFAEIRSYAENTDVKRVALYGISQDSALLGPMLKECGIDVTYRIQPHAHQAVEHPLLALARFLDALNGDPVDAILIADYPMQSAYVDAIRYLDLDAEHVFYSGFEQQASDPELFINFGDESVLNKAFRLRRLGLPTGRL